MQSTGQTATHAVSMQSLHKRVMIYAIAPFSPSADPVSGSDRTMSPAEFCGL
jgi:hypothetical protein